MLGNRSSTSWRASGPLLAPTFVTEIARFKIISGIGLYGSIGAPILIYAASDLMQFYIYRQFLSTISVSLDESALLDGCSYFQLRRGQHDDDDTRRQGLPGALLGVGVVHEECGQRPLLVAGHIQIRNVHVVDNGSACRLYSEIAGF